MPIEFRDYSIEVSAKMKDAAKRFLIEAAHEVTSQTIRTTSPKKQQLRGSWGNSVDENAMTAQIGSPLEESFWNEFGTGSHAIHGDGRKGWWVYIEGQPRGEKNSRVYDSQQEAEEAVAYLRSKGLPAVATNGEDAHLTLQKAFAAKKNTIVRMAETILGEEMK